MELTLDSIKDIKLYQPKRGYRFSVDALLLFDFISLTKPSRGVELGTGSGIISLLVARKFKKAEITGIEIQKMLAGCAEKNIKLNRVDDRVRIINEDIRNIKKVLPANKFDLVFSNPPFRKTKTGRLSADNGRAVARHEIKISLPDIIEAASYLLKHAGKFYLIYHPFRLAELISLLQKEGLEPKRMRFVHSREGEEAKMVLIEAQKGSGTWLKIEPPLYIHKKGKEYTDEMKRVYGDLS